MAQKPISKLAQLGGITLSLTGADRFCNKLLIPDTNIEDARDGLRRLGRTEALAKKLACVLPSQRGVCLTFTESRYALIIPALDEADSIGKLLQQIPREMFCQVIVVDNGSQDSTADVARNAGAQVVQESGRGYGQACLTGLASLSREATAIVFMDGDLSDDPAILPRLLQFFEEGRWDLVIGSRTLGCSEAGSLTPLQRFGNWLATRLIRWIWDVSFTDLGMPRVAGREALNRLKLRDRGFGWNVEMQAKAARLHLRVAEVPIAYRRRRYGKSKISGTVSGSIRAGLRILSTIYRCWSNPLDE